MTLFAAMVDLRPRGSHSEIEDAAGAVAQVAADTADRDTFEALVRATAASWGLYVADFDYAAVSLGHEFLDAARSHPGEGFWTALHAYDSEDD